MEQQNSLFGGALSNEAVTSLKANSKKRSLTSVFNLNIKGETDYVGRLDLDSQTVLYARSLFQGIKKVKKDGKEKFFFVTSTIFKGLEDILDGCEWECKNEDEVRETLNNHIAEADFLIEKNKSKVFFDGRRYFWKAISKDKFECLGWSA